MYREVNKLRFSDLADLIEGKIVALRCPNFYSEELCKIAVDRIEKFDTKDFYEVTKNNGMMKKIGKAIFDYAGKPNLIDEYYEQVEPTNELLQYFFSGLIPMQEAYNLISTIYPNGTCLESFHNKKMYYGLIREFPCGSFALPHQDMTEWDIPESEVAHKIQKQFAINVYLQVPKRGGEIRIFNYGFEDKSQYKNAKLPNSYGIDIDKLFPSPAYISVKPSCGDLIIFNSRMLHAVTEVTSNETRITTSCFMNFYGNSEPLKFFS